MRLKLNFWVLVHHETLVRYSSSSQHYFILLTYVRDSWNISWGRHQGLIPFFWPEHCTAMHYTACALRKPKTLYTNIIQIRRTVNSLLNCILFHQSITLKEVNDTGKRTEGRVTNESPVSPSLASHWLLAPADPWVWPCNYSSSCAASHTV